MPFTVPKASSPPRIKRESTRAWLGGVSTTLDDGRTPNDALIEAGNMILEQNGVLRPRPSLTPYGPPFLGTVLGEVFEFSRMESGKKVYYLLTVQNVSGTAKAYVAKGESTSWTECTGATFNNSAQCHFLQVDNKLLVMNGVDYLAYIDTSNFTVTVYTTLTTPAAPTLDTNTGLIGTVFKVYYAVTANSTVGETAGSPVLTQQVLKDRDMWNPDTENIKIKWTTVAGVKSWNVYAGIAADGAGQPKLYCIASGIEPGTLAFTDNGTRQLDISRPLPTTNGTAGPRAKRGTVSEGRVFLVGDADNQYYLWRGGDYKFELDFSPSNGGGYTPIGNGTKDVPIAVKAFRNGKGDPMVMILTQGSNGSGKRFYISPTNVTYGSSTFVVWKVSEDSGIDGTDSPDGLVIYNDNVYYPSRDGFKTTGTKPQLQNILSTDKISNTIQESISQLNTAAMDKAVGIAYENRIYWSLPVNSTKNSQIWVLDLERKGAWMMPWSIAADWLTLYNDNSGRTHFLALVNNTLCEFSRSTLTMDSTGSFLTSATSGQVRFSEDGREWGRLIQLVMVLLRPQGTVNVSVTAKTEDGLLEFRETQSFSGKSTRAGWSEPQIAWSSSRGWSGIKAIPKSFNTATEEMIIEVDEDVQWYQYNISTTEPGVDYGLSEVVSEYVNVGIKDLS